MCDQSWQIREIQYTYIVKRDKILFFRIVCFRGPSEEGVKKAGQKDLIEGECQDCSTSERKTVIQLFYRKKYPSPLLVKSLNFIFGHIFGIAETNCWKNIKTFNWVPALYASSQSKIKKAVRYRQQRWNSASISHKKRPSLKGQCQEMFDTCCRSRVKRLFLGPTWTCLNAFANFFVIAKIFDHKVRKLSVPKVNDAIFLYIRRFSYF